MDNAANPFNFPSRMDAPLSQNPPGLSGVRLFQLLLWARWRSLWTNIRAIRSKSRLMLFVLGSFILGYLGVGYFLFYEGLQYLHHFPIVGSLIAQRILFLVFAFFFLMLVFSNGIIGYASLFKNRETSWLLTLPVSHRSVYRWKFAESLVVSSWALMFLSAPMMAAYGRVHNVQPLFYIEVAAAYLPFIVLPALAGSWGILFFVRALSKPWMKKALLLAAVLIVVSIVFGVKPVGEAEAEKNQDVLSFNVLLRHTRMSLNPLLPSAWLARSVLSWSEGLWRQGAFFFLVLLSNALMGLLVGFEIVGRFFYSSWTVAASSRAERFQRKAEAKRQKIQRLSVAEWIFHRLPFLSRSAKALSLKDVRIFWRDPAQWTQFMIFFALLCIYVLNLRHVSFDMENQFWAVLISDLNLAASSLTLSTLTTRFVFPQFSLEGRRLWIIGLAPVGLKKVLLQKFWLSCFGAASVTVSLMVVSSVMLHLPWHRVVFFGGAIAVMSATLCGIAVGIGALFPNLKEDNPSKIVSGFGGTLCLVLSFIYIACFVALVSVPGLRRVIPVHFLISDATALGLAVFLSAGMLAVPMILAMKRVKNLEF